ncbi:MAG: O-antigen ligase family protein [Saprospiraceae bacterium]
MYYLIGLASRPIQFEGSYADSITKLLMLLVTSFIIYFTTQQYLYRRLIVENKEIQVFNAFIVPVVISSLYAIYQQSMGIRDIVGSQVLHGYARTKGVYGNPNALGYVANLGQLLILYSLYKHDKWYWLKLLLLPAMLYVSFLSLSRASMITSVALLLIVIGWITVKFLNVGRKARFRHFFIVAIPTVIFTYITLNFETLLHKYTKFGTTKKILSLIDLFTKGKVDNSTTSGRTELVEFGMHKIAERPFFGNGLGFFRRFPEDTGLVHGVHNTYLLVLGDAGLFAFAAMMIFIFYVLIKSLFVKTFSGLLAFGCMFIWAMHNIGGHNGLEDKMYNIMVMFSVMYLWYGQKQQKIERKLKLKT